MMKETKISDGVTFVEGSTPEKEKADMIKQLEMFLQMVRDGKIVSFMICGVHDDKDVFMAGITPARHAELQHASIIGLHEAFHDGIDAAQEVQEVENNATSRTIN